MSVTKDRIMEVARRMVQSNGYNALSFREIAKEVGIKSAAVHYHFPTKGDLGAALAKKYAEDAQKFCDELSVSSESLGKILQNYTNVFRAALTNDNRMCLYGIMAAEYDDLPNEVRIEVDHFTDVNLQFLRTILKRVTPKAGDADVEKHALALFSAIEGAQLVARGRADVTLFDRALEGHRSVGLLPQTR